jgi:predicted Zn-dependent protease
MLIFLPRAKTNKEDFHTFSHELGHAMGLADAYPMIDKEYGIYTEYSDP